MPDHTLGVLPDAYSIGGLLHFIEWVYMRVLQVIQGVSNLSAGSTYFVGKMADELHIAGCDSSILTLGKRPHKWPYQAPLTMHDEIIGKKTGVSLSLLRDVRKRALLPGILHGHGVWRATNLFPLLLNENSPSKIVFSTHGAIAPWSMSRKSSLKVPFWRMLQRPALNRSHCIHVTSACEYEDVRRAGIRGAVAVIPIGIDIPDIPFGHQRQKRIVFIGRIDPVKGLDMLIPAWRVVADKFPEWELVIAGPLDGEYADSIMKRAGDLNTPRIKFTGELLGDKKSELLTSASLFVLPSYSENFGIVVAEALAHGVPVITTTSTPWHEISERGMGWIIKPEQSALENALHEALQQPLPVLQEMGLRGREWMRDSYSWRRVGIMMQQTYGWLLHGGIRPAWIEQV